MSNLYGIIKRFKVLEIRTAFLYLNVSVSQRKKKYQAFAY